MVDPNTVLKLLDKIPIWKKIKELPGRVTVLEKRIDELELMFRTSSENKCPSCGEYKFFVKTTNPHSAPMLRRAGVVEREYECESCGFNETQTINPV